MQNQFVPFRVPKLTVPRRWPILPPVPIRSPKGSELATLNQKRQLDSLVGVPLCAVLGVLTRAAGFLARRDHSLRRSPDRILFIKLVGQGSIINCTHLLRAAKDRWPLAELHFVSFAEVRPLLDRIPEIDRLHTLDDRSYLRLLFSTLAFLFNSWRLGFDLVVDLEVHSKCSTALSTLTGANDRAGYFLDTTLFRRTLYTHLVFYNRLTHIQEAYRQLGRAVCLEPGVGKPPAPVIPQGERDAVSGLLDEWGCAGRKVLLVNVNAGELCLERRWPGERFARLIGLLAAREDVRVILTGSPAEAEYVESVRGLVEPELRESVVNSAGQTTYGQFLALLEAGELLLTGDTGPMHLAASVGTATVSLWGPTLPCVFQPPGDEHRAIRHGAYCSPCIGWVPAPPCAGRNVCMDKIGVGEVALMVGEALGIALEIPAGLDDFPDCGAGSGYLEGHVARSFTAPAPSPLDEGGV